MTTFDPLTAPEPEEVPLAHAPLVRVLAQVRFPPLLNLGSSGQVARFQELVRDAYPILTAESSSTLAVDQAGNISVGPTEAWRFVDLSESWRLSLTPNFVALESKAYTSRSEFLRRWEVVLSATHSVVDPRVATRLGIRYIDRVDATDRDSILKLVRPEVGGTWPSFANERVNAIVTDTWFKHEVIQMHARFGLLPSGSTIDPGALEPVEHPSWILDIDTFTDQRMEFNVERLREMTGNFAGRTYTFFRWAVTDEFLERFRGTP